MAYNATVKIKGNTIENVDTIMVTNTPEVTSVKGTQIHCYKNGKLRGTITVPLNQHGLKVSVMGDVQNLHSNNCAVINGNIQYIKVGNTLRVEGNVNTDKCNRSVHIDLYYYVGIDRDTNLMVAANEAKSRPTTLYIDGNLKELRLALLNGYHCVNEIDGNVRNAVIVNCAEVKGDVKSCDVANCCIATFGKTKSNKKKNREAMSRKLKENKDLLKGYGSF